MHIKSLKPPQKFNHYLPGELVNSSNRIQIVLVGAGGNGSPMITGLARIDCALKALGHPGISLSVMDGDTVSSSNIGRQMFSPADIGKNKAVVSVTRVNMFFGLRWQAFPIMVEASHIEEIRKKAHVVIGAVDRFRSRQLLQQIVRDRPMYWLDMGNSKHTGQVILGTGDYIKQPGKQQCIGRLPTILELFPGMEEDENADYQGPSCSMEEALLKQDLFINTAISTFALDLLWQALRNGHLSIHGTFINLDSFRVSPIAVDSEGWSSLGWQQGRKSKKRAKAAA